MTVKLNTSRSSLIRLCTTLNHCLFRVWVDIIKFSEYWITPRSVSNAVKQNPVFSPSHRIF